VKPRRQTRAAPAATAAEHAQLLDAADTLAARANWTQLKPAAVCRAAGLPPAAFKRHFADTSAYLAATQQRFMDGIRDRIVERTQALPPGFERLRAASEIYLDGCLARNQLRGWLIQARAAQPALAEGLARQNQVYGMVMRAEFDRLGWPHPAAAAQLYLSMLMEAGLAEFTAGRAVPDVRETLWDFLKIYA
jgi:AcrR family transcriptional regulator